MGYAFCQMQEQPFSTNMVPFKSLFIDDLCVDQQARGPVSYTHLDVYKRQTLSSVMTDDVSQRTALSRYRSLGGTIFMTVMVRCV